MFDWLNPWVFIQTMARVLLVWFAFYGAGRLLRKPSRIDFIFPLLPSEVLGMLAFIVLAVPLSLSGLLNRTVCPVLLMLMVIPGVLFSFGALRDRIPMGRPGVLEFVMGPFILFILILNFTHASMPNLAFDDPLVTYAVQPDRWLNAGRIHWLGETTFSGFPMLYEMTAIWPASLSSDRMNQLSVLQVFQMSLLVAAVFRGLYILRIRRRLWIPVASVILVSTLLFIWCSKAKTDAMAILFTTLALASAIRERESGFSGRPFSSWLFMGLALATKVTAVVVMVPFLLYSIGAFLKFPAKWKLIALVSLMAVPVVFAVRTMLKTGSPTYPVYPVTQMLKDGWELSEPEEQVAVGTRDSYLYEDIFFPLPKQVGIFFASMEGSILLLLAGVIATLVTGKRAEVYLAVPVLIYGIACIVAFWPPWWGAKYSILAYPFIGLLGGRLLQRSNGSIWIATSVLAVSFLIPGFVMVAGDARPFTYRITVTRSILNGNWSEESGYAMYMSTPEGMTHMWANSALPSDATIFSINEEKRYFFDGTVIVGWRHPLGQRLYLENSLEDELAILDSLGVDYVGFYREDPTLLEQEDRLAILDHIGFGDVLEPVIIVDGGYLLCRLNSH